jgi:enoyl-[acyl-carrier protein] reductase I
MENSLLKGKRGIIFGALNDKSIAWHVALKSWQQGAELILTNSPVALRLGSLNQLADITGSKVIPADATKMEDIDNLITESMKIFGGQFDFILHSIGMSPNVRKDIPYEQTNYENMLKTFDISALSFHRILQTAYKLDALCVDLADVPQVRAEVPGADPRHRRHLLRALPPAGRHPARRGARNAALGA